VYLGYPFLLSWKLKGHFEVLNPCKITDELRFAVRSSANIEDGNIFSFAGQADTFLFRKDLNGIISSVKACWSSLFNPRALLYLSQMNKLHKKTELNQIYMAVIVQEMINSDISGVLFTVNVLNNNIKEMLINSTWGLGEALANNCVIPDTLIINKHTYNIIKTILGKKEKTAMPDYAHSTTKLVKTSRKLQKVCCLNKKHIKKICEVGNTIEQLYNCPQDIEWTIKDDELFILQTRPITTFKKSQKESEK
jgi:pyruvate,water dikinase